MFKRVSLLIALAGALAQASTVNVGQIFVTLPLSVELAGSAQGAFASNASASSGLSHALPWAGSQRVTQAGRSLPFEVASGSGTNYAQFLDVPQLSTALLLGGAFALGWIVTRLILKRSGAA